MAKVKTTKIADKFDYALVPDRLKEFREQNPRASIKHQETVAEDGSVVIRATIIKDKSKPDSADAQGSARYTTSEMKIKKAYEKLETIATGRALANLGYLNDGKIASTEEMEEYHAYKDEKIELAIDTLMACDTMYTLKETFLGLGNLIASDKVVTAKDIRKEQLEERNVDN